MTKNNPIVSSEVCDSLVISSFAALLAFAKHAAETSYVPEHDCWTTTETVTVAPPSTKTIAA